MLLRSIHFFRTGERSKCGYMPARYDMDGRLEGYICLSQTSIFAVMKKYEASVKFIEISHFRSIKVIWFYSKNAFPCAVLVRCHHIALVVHSKESFISSQFNLDQTKRWQDQSDDESTVAMFTSQTE